MEVGSFVVPDAQASKLVEPSKSALHVGASQPDRQGHASRVTNQVTHAASLGAIEQIVDRDRAYSIDLRKQVCR